MAVANGLLLFLSLSCLVICDGAALISALPISFFGLLKILSCWLPVVDMNVGAGVVAVVAVVVAGTTPSYMVVAVFANIFAFLQSVWTFSSVV